MASASTETFKTLPALQGYHSLGVARGSLHQNKEHHSLWALKKLLQFQNAQHQVDPKGATVPRQSD